MEIIGVKVRPTNYLVATQEITTWGQHGDSRYVCIATVHSIMEAYDSLEFKKILNKADLVTPDGMPLVWMLRLKGYPSQTRVYGPTLMIQVIEKAAEKKIPIGFYGGSPSSLATLRKKFTSKFPSLRILYSSSPPYRELTQDEDNQICDGITKSGVEILFVGLGCPKQERWMAAHNDRLKLVMVGVGAAFDFHSGVKPQAPPWMQNAGMEWVFRLLTEPRRLWKRYFYHNPRFIILAIADLLGLIH